MAGKKHSVLKATMLIALIMTLNLIGVSYGFWQDSLVSELRANTGYTELSFKEEPEEESDGFIMLSAELEDDEERKVIEVTGRIESGAIGEFQLDYTVENSGSLPIEFDDDEFLDVISQIEGFTLVSEPEGRDIGPEDSLSDSIAILVNASELDYTPADDSNLNGSEEDTYTVLGEFDFDIVLPYYFSSWTDELTITGNIEVVQSPVLMMLIPVPAMTSVPVQDGIVPGELPGSSVPDPTQQDGGSTAGDDTEEADEPETVEDDSEPAAEGDDEGEGSDDQGQTDADDTTVEADEPETVEDDSEPAAEGDDEGEGTDDQGQTDADDTTVEADEPETVEDDSEPAAEGDDEGEGSDDQGQTDADEIIN